MSWISWRGAWHVWQRSIYIYRRTWLTNMLPNFFEPVIYLFGLGAGLGAYVNADAMQGQNYLTYLAPGLIVSNAMNGGAFETTYNLFLKMRFNRTYDAITATPINIEDAMVGELLWATTRGALYGLIFAFVVAVMGLLDFTSLAMMLPVTILTGWLFGAVGFIFTSFIKVIDMFSFFYTLFLTPMFLFSGIFFPLDKLSPALLQVAWFTPLYHAVRLSRGVMFHQLTWEHAIDAAWMFCVAAILSVWGIYRVRKQTVY